MNVSSVLMCACEKVRTMEHSPVEKRPISNDLGENIFGPILSKVDESNVFHDIHIDKTEFKIGRARDNDEIILDALISRRHCIITCEGDDEWVIRDLSSSVTFVNNVPLKAGISKTLHDGDIIQFSTSEKYTYLFNLCNDHKRKRIKLEDDSSLENVIMREKTFAEDQEYQKKAFIDKLQVKQQEQDKLKQELETLLMEQDITKNSAEAYKKEIATLERKIKEGNEQIEHLNTLFKELSEKLENERFQFEKKLKEEKEKWQQVLNVNKLEKEMLELKMTNLMETKAKEEKDKAQLLNEKIVLEKRLQETEEALKEKEETVQNVAGPSYMDPNDSVIFVEILNNPLGYQVIDQIDLTETSEVVNVENEQDNIINKFSNILDEQLACSVCSELFIKATTLGCMHTFCNACIKCWMKKKKLCPVCRAPIQSMTKSIVVDNLIDSMLENLPTHLKEKRKQLLKEREGIEGKKKRVPRKKN